MEGTSSDQQGPAGTSRGQPTQVPTHQHSLALGSPHPLIIGHRLPRAPRALMQDTQALGSARRCSIRTPRLPQVLDFLEQDSISSRHHRPDCDLDSLLETVFFFTPPAVSFPL